MSGREEGPPGQSYLLAVALSAFTSRSSRVERAPPQLMGMPQRLLKFA